MKKIFLIFIVCFCALTAQAQTTHLKLKGVPIDGTRQEFIQRMEAAGFTYIDSLRGVSTLQGDFAGYKDCKIKVSTLDSKDLVSKVTAEIQPSQNTWPDLYATYKQLKSLLKEKYGNPTYCVEKFNDPAPENDFIRELKILFDAFNYTTKFTSKGGDIELKISSDYFVAITYTDKINSNIIRKTAIDDL